MFPKWISRGMLTMFVLHDIMFLATAVLAITNIPPTIESTMRPYAWFWISMVGFGSVTGIAGTLTRNVGLEAFGCGLMIGGLLVYAIAVFARFFANPYLPSTLAAGTIFLAAAFSIGWRIFAMFGAIYLREDPR